MKRKTAKEVLVETFREIAEKKSVDRISIREIIEASGYSKTTFYREFRDKYDLMAWDYVQRHNQIIDKTENEDYHWKNTLLDGNKLFDSQKDYLKNLLLHTSGYYSFSDYMKRVHYESLRRMILHYSKITELDVKTQIYAKAYCHSTTDLICEWILGKYDLTPEELAEILENLLPNPLSQYLS